MELIGAAYLILKAERAQVHLDALNRELDLFLKEPYTITRKDDVQNGRHVRRTQLKPNDPVIAMLLGEFLYSLRSGLDQMAWQLSLAVARSDPKTRGNICFPIYENFSNPDTQKTYAKVRKYFPDAVAAEIDSLQPHNGSSSPQEHPLWQLNRLCNLDKHRLIPFHSRTMPIYFPNNPAAKVQHFEGEYAIEVSVPIKDKRQLDIEPDGTCLIEFGDWEVDWHIPRQRLSEIHDFIVNSVIPRFMQFKFSALFENKLRIGDIKPSR